jgi:hypothetical protein
VYSIAYGSVPIFIPQLWPHSYYNARYGMELLPALALYGVYALAVLERRLMAPEAGSGAKLMARVLAPVAVAVAVMNSFGMIYRIPAVLKEGIVNSRTRVPFEQAIARVLEDLPPGVPVLMNTSDHVGALQDAGIPLKQTINDGEYYSWHAALKDPAHQAAFIVAIVGDPVADAVAKHPDNLEEMTILCTTGQPCAHIYRSTAWGAVHLPAPPQ